MTIKASGQYQVAKTGGENKETWRSEAGGITLDYYRGQPLGKLLCGIADLQTEPVTEESLAGLFKPHFIGLGGEIVVERDGILCFRINESTARLDDNDGGLIVEVVR